MKNSILAKRATGIFCAITILALSLTSCGAGAKNKAMDNGYYKDMQESKIEYSGGFSGNYYEISDSAADYDAPMAETELYATEDGKLLEVEKSESQTSRKIIYSSDYEIQTKHYDESVALLDALMAKYGAYFESSNTYGTAESGNRRSNYRVRVPVENYRAFTGETGNLGVVISSAQNNKDVTESYFDTEARLESAKIREERVLEILKNADMLDDVLALERELADIRYEIESFTGTLRKYDSLVNFSTVNLSIREVTDVVVPKTTPLTFGERIGKGFNSGINDFVESFQDFVVFLSYNFIGIVIWLAIIGIAVGILVGVSRKKKRANKSSSDNGEIK